MRIRLAESVMLAACRTHVTQHVYALVYCDWYSQMPSRTKLTLGLSQTPSNQAETAFT